MGTIQSKSKALAVKNAEIEKLKREKEEVGEKLQRLEKKKEVRSLEIKIEVPEGVLTSCSICCSPYNKRKHLPVSFPCGHTTCSHCAGSLTNYTCPICRAVDNFRKLAKNFLACDLLEQINLSKDTILLIGGIRSGRVYNNMIVLSSDRSKWVESHLQLPHHAPGSGAAFLNGEIYIFGGCDSKQLYKLDKNLKWIRLADMNIGHGWITNSCLVWNGYIWVFGGREFISLKSVERYDPKEDKWTLMPDMIHARSHASVALWKDRIVITGGNTVGNNGTNTVECFYPEHDCWMELPELPTYLQDHSLVSFKKKLIAIAGTQKNSAGSRVKCFRDVLELNPHESKPEWKPLPAVRHPIFAFVGIVLDEEIYAIGGSQGGKSFLDQVEIFDGDCWRDGPRLPCAATDMSAMIIPQHLADCICSNSQ